MCVLNLRLRAGDENRTTTTNAMKQGPQFIPKLRGKKVLSMASTYTYSKCTYRSSMQLKYPDHITIETTSRCNLKCIMCRGIKDRSWVKTTENHHANRTHEIHFGSKHRLRRRLALFSRSRTRPKDINATDLGDIDDLVWNKWNMLNIMWI